MLDSPAHILRTTVRGHLGSAGRRWPCTPASITRVLPFLFLLCMPSFRNLHASEPGTLALSRAIRDSTAELRRLPASFTGNSRELFLLSQARSAPLSLAAGDLNGDGVVDLVCGFGTPEGGLLSVHLGNPRSLFPTDEEGYLDWALGRRWEPPFQVVARVFPVPTRPDFLEIEDFDGDASADVLSASRGGEQLNLYSGDGRGGLGLLRSRELPGPLQALVAGEFGRVDRQPEIVASTSGDRELITILAGGRGAWYGEVQSVPLPGIGKALVLGRLVADPFSDLIVGTGEGILLIDGRDRYSAFPGATSGPEISYSLGGQLDAVGLAIGHFSGDRHRQLAVLASDGEIHVFDGFERASAAGVSSRRTTPAGDGGSRRLTPGSVPPFVTWRQSGSLTEDLLLFDSETSMQALRVTPENASEGETGAVEFELAPKAVLALRLNPDSRNDLVVLDSRGRGIWVLETVPQSTFSVNNAGNQPDGFLNGTCDTGTLAEPTGICTLRAALMEANRNPDSDMISIQGGLVITPADTQNLDGFPISGQFSVDHPVTIVGNGAIIDGSALKNGQHGLVIFGTEAVVRTLEFRHAPPNGHGLVLDSAFNSFVEVSQFTSNSRNGIMVQATAGPSMQNSIGGAGGNGNSFSSNFNGIGFNDSFGNGVVETEVRGNTIGGATGNTSSGIFLAGTDARIVDNTISNNGNRGIDYFSDIDGSLVQGNTVTGNIGGGIALTTGHTLIGGPSQGQGNSIQGNGGFGIDGGADIVERNMIQDNQGPGIRFGASPFAQNISILNNSIDGNSGLGLDAGYNSTPDANDDPDDDGLINFPLLELSPDGTQLSGSLQSKASSSFKIQLFESSSCDPSGFGEGDQWVASLDVMTDENGFAEFEQILGAPVDPEMTALTATTTWMVGGQPNGTSEFSACAAFGAETDIVVNSTSDFLQEDGQSGLAPDAVRCTTGREIPGGEMECTLRAAIELAGRLSESLAAQQDGPRRILFDIPGPGPHVIQPVRPYPVIDTPVEIDARTSPVTCAVGVGVDGSLLEEGSLLTLGAGGSSLQGLALFGSPESGLVLAGDGGHRVACNHIGADLGGDPPAQPTRGSGILIAAGSDENEIGGSDENSSNLIAFNQQAGIRIPGGNEVPGAATGNAILSNSIRDNGELGIDLGEEGPDRNDLFGDGDEGANGLQNYPELRFTECNEEFSECSSLAVFLEANPGTTYRFQIFKNAECDPSAFGEGDLLLSTFDESSPVGENGDFEVEIALVPALSPLQTALSATVTELVNGIPRSTSEFSACSGGKTVVVNTLADYVIDPEDTFRRGLKEGASACDTGRDPVTRNGVPEPECTLRAAIEFADVLKGTTESPIAIRFDIPDQSGGVIHLEVPMASIETPVIIDARDIDPGTGSCRPTIGIDGTLSEPPQGFTVLDRGSSIRGLAVYGFGERAIVLDGQGGHQLQCNYIGLNLEGNRSGNDVAVDVLSDDNRIGSRLVSLDGTAISADRNVISGNRIGIRLYGSRNVIQGNFVGPDLSGGESGLGGHEPAIEVVGDDNLIGARLSAVGLYGRERGNLISANELGIRIAGGDRTRIQGNAIGTDSTGTKRAGNFLGVAIVLQTPTGSPVRIPEETEIGGPDPESGNLVSGNFTTGIGISAGQATIRNNRIGTDSSGTVSIPNESYGIEIFSFNVSPASDPDVLIGAADSSGTNLISGNGGSGVRIDADHIRVFGNLIGTRQDGVSPLGNGRDGISITLEKERNHILGNTIAFNGRHGVFAEREGGFTGKLSKTRIEKNRIFRNGESGISVSPLRPLKLEAAVEVDGEAVSAAGGSSPASVQVRGVRSKAEQVIEFFSSTECEESANPSPLSEGERFLDSVAFNAGENFSLNPFLAELSAANLIGPWITATSTLGGEDFDDETTNFSNCIFVSLFPPLGGVLEAALGGLEVTPGPATRVRGAILAAIPEKGKLSQAAGDKAVSTPVEGIHVELGARSGAAQLQGELPARFTLTLLLPPSVEPDSFFNYGPTVEDPSDHWYEFLFDGDTGAEIDGNQVVLHFVDGARGDHDLEVNGRVSSFGAPIVLAERLLFPLDLSAAEQFVGVAVSNLASEGSHLLEFELHPAGQGLPGDLPPGTNRALREIEGGSQLAELTGQLFPAGSTARTGDGWFELLSSAAKVGSFFQFGSFDLSQLDGSVAITETSTQLLFPRVFEGPTAYRGQPATTLISLANPSEERVELTLRIHPFEAGPAPQGFARSVSLELGPLDSIHQSVAGIFGDGVDVARGFVEVEVTSGPGVIGFERIQLLDHSTVIGLNAVPLGSEVDTFFSAQFATQAGVLFTNLNLINPSQQSRELSLTLIAQDGTVLGEPQILQLGPGEQLSQDAAAIFSAAASGLQPNGMGDFTGSLQVEADGPGLVGDVIFGDPAAFGFAAALPLQAETFREAVFSQVANVPGFFTGLALFNPGTVTASVRIEVFSAAGVLVGQNQIELAAGRRTSKLVPELVPDSDGQAGGYIRIRSDQPLIAQQLFAAFDAAGIRLFSAVPPTLVQ